ncbi:Transposon Tf2-9 polyprotein, partial [Dictyocoela muelleri]
RMIQSDNGKEFTNTLIHELCKEFNILLIHGRPRHPQTQGQVERFNQTLTRSIAKILMHSNDVEETHRWSIHLKRVTYEYNLAVHSATRKTPFELLFMRKGLNTVTAQALEIEETNSSLVVGNILEDSDIFNEIAAHQAKYFERMDRKAVHNSKYEFKVGEKFFFLKKNDANASTVRIKLDSLFHKVAEILKFYQIID